MLPVYHPADNFEDAVIFLFVCFVFIVTEHTIEESKMHPATTLRSCWAAPTSFDVPADVFRLSEASSPSDDDEQGVLVGVEV